MVVISKDEKIYLESQGCVIGRDIHKTRTRYKKYFMTESPKNKKLLEKFRGDRYVSNNVSG